MYYSHVPSAGFTIKEGKQAVGRIDGSGKTEFAWIHHLTWTKFLPAQRVNKKRIWVPHKFQLNLQSKLGNAGGNPRGWRQGEAESGTRWKYAGQGSLAAIQPKSLRIQSLLVLPRSWRREPGGLWGAFGQALVELLQWTQRAGEGNDELTWQFAAESNTTGAEEGAQTHPLNWSHPLPYYLILYLKRSFLQGRPCHFMLCELQDDAGPCAESWCWPQSEKANSGKMPTATRRDRSWIL